MSVPKELHTYYKVERELLCPDANTIYIASEENDSCVGIPIDEAIARARVDREFRRRMKYPEDLDRQVTEFLTRCLNTVREHCWVRMTDLRPRLTIQRFENGVARLHNKIRRSFLELAKNSFWHGNFGDARTPFRIEMEILGHVGEKDDRIVLNFLDSGDGIKDEEKTAEGGFGRQLVKQSMDLMHDRDLDPPVGPYTFMVVTSRNLLRDMLAMRMPPVKRRRR